MKILHKKAHSSPLINKTITIFTAIAPTNFVNQEDAVAIVTPAQNPPINGDLIRPCPPHQSNYNTFLIHTTPEAPISARLNFFKHFLSRHHTSKSLPLCSIYPLSPLPLHVFFLHLLLLRSIYRRWCLFSLTEMGG